MACTSKCIGLYEHDGRQADACNKRDYRHDSQQTYIAGLMPTEARGNYLPEASYFRETKTYLNCNSRIQCMGTSNLHDYQHNTTISVQFSSSLSQLQ